MKAKVAGEPTEKPHHSQVVKKRLVPYSLHEEVTLAEENRGRNYVHNTLEHCTELEVFNAP